MPADNRYISDILAPSGVLRAGINLSNFLLVSSRASDGTPQGISPDMAGWVAAALDLPFVLVPFNRPGELANAVDQDQWDIGNIAFEAERAKTIAFSTPYVVIDANFLFRADAHFDRNEDVDSDGVKIAVSERSAYDLWLTDHFKKAEICRAPSIAAAHEMFHQGAVDVLASLKPKLLEEIDDDPSLKMLDTPFAAVNQSIGVRQSISVRQGQPDIVAFLNDVIVRRIADGSVAAALKRHGVDTKLSIPDPA
jgi:polar amino acid transport system substrate-binding protein